MTAGARSGVRPARPTMPPGHASGGDRTVRPRLAATLAVAAVGGVMALSGSAAAVPALFSAFALASAAFAAVRMVRAVFRKAFGIDLLAVTAIVSTVLVGESVAALVIVVMLTGGEALEDHARRRSSRQLDRLLSAAPTTAHRAVPGGVEDVPVDEVRVGDELVVRPLEVVPVDARLLVHAAAFDESSLTGESIPVEVAAGDAVASGAVNGSVAVRMRATAEAADSEYQRIVTLVASAMTTRAPTVKLADRYAPWFTVFSLALAGTAWWIAGDPLRFAEVLVLATPCPLLIAAPVAFVGGIGRAARADVVVKDATVLEALAAARTVVFDKTGTLTEGRPTLARVVLDAGGPVDADRLLQLAASAEQYSSHTLADSVVAAARARGLTLSVAEGAAEAGSDGVSARVDGHDVGVGTLAFARRRAAGVRPPDDEGGAVVVHVTIDARPAGALLLRDPVRADAQETVRALRTLGLESCVMLTGDAAATAERVARAVDVSVLGAECRPADKVAAVRALLDRPVLMVGDGVNDAPVLAAADVGVAMGARGASAASESADAVVLVESLGRVADAVRIGRDTVRIARQSIWLGMAASVGLMLVAVSGTIPPVLGAVLQEGVDVATILAALRASRAE